MAWHWKPAIESNHRKIYEPPGGGEGGGGTVRISWWGFVAGTLDIKLDPGPTLAGLQTGDVEVQKRSLYIQQIEICQTGSY